MSGLSFKFNKKSTINKRIHNKHGHDEDEDDGGGKDTVEYVTAINEKEIQSSAPKQQKKDLIIPLIKNNNWRIPADKSKKVEKAVDDDVQEDTESKPHTLEDIAKFELLEDAAKANDRWEKRGDNKNSKIIPLVMQNTVPDGYETKDKLDVSLRPDQPTIDDYDKVPVEEFGLAMLRGMGWKPGEPVGKSSKGVVQPVEVIIRPKGLGLGAAASAKIVVQNEMKDKELKKS